MEVDHSAADKYLAGVSVANSALSIVDHQRWDAAYSVLHGFSECACEDLLERVPVMPATLLGLELVLSSSCINLNEVSDLVLSDLGATIHVLRLVGQEYGAVIDRPLRMSECLASLPVQEWFDALARAGAQWPHGRAEYFDLWQHCHSIARHAIALAENSDQVSPEEARMVGLLHGYDAMINQLASGDKTGMLSYSLCTAIEGLFPLFVHDALCGNTVAKAQPWRNLLRQSHDRLDAEARCECQPYRSFTGLSSGSMSGWIVR